MENFKLLAIKVVAVAYERLSLTRGSKYSDLPCKLLGFWKLVAEERWLQPEVRLYSSQLLLTSDSWFKSVHRKTNYGTVWVASATKY